MTTSPTARTGSSLSPTERTRVRRHSERARTERSDLHAVLDAGLVCHLGVVVDGAPVVLPTGYARVGDTLYLHGSSANRSLRAAADGASICVTVTHLDGLVLARSVFNHSMNYRCAVIFGTARPVDERAEKLAGLRAITEHLAPGQWDAARGPTRKELAATTLLTVSLDEASVKIRSGPPGNGDSTDAEQGIWSGVLPIRQVFGEVLSDSTLECDIEVPAHIRRLTGTEVGRLSTAM